LGISDAVSEQRTTDSREARERRHSRAGLAPHHVISGLIAPAANCTVFFTERASR
jgi:hypothetical protein